MLTIISQYEPSEEELAASEEKENGHMETDGPAVKLKEEPNGADKS